MNWLCVGNPRILASLALCAGLASCNTVPAPLEGSPPLPEPAPPIVEDAPAPGPGPEAGAPLYSLAPAALPPPAAAEPRPGLTPDSPSASTHVELRRPDPSAVLEELPYASLVEEIRKRLTTEWSTISGGLGDTAAPEARAQLARRLLAVRFLLEDPPAEDPHFEEALTFARAREGKGEAASQLLVAAHLSESGRLEEARELVRSLFGLDQNTRAIAASEPFVVSNLHLARSIEGPGSFVPVTAADIAPGKAVLLYGEFENFLSICEEPGEEEEATFRRCFSASLRLVAASGKEVDRLDFLPESRGVHVGNAQVEIVNFWARYRIPERLRSGKYTLVVEGRDVLGAKSASARLELEIPPVEGKPPRAAEGQGSEGD